MSDCGDSDDQEKLVLIYACSGAANVGEVADRAARELMAAGVGAMFCLAGVGGNVQKMIQAAGKADLNVLIDGCPLGCAREVFESHGLTNYVQIKVTDLDIARAEDARATDEQVAVTVAKVREAIGEDV